MYMYQFSLVTQSCRTLCDPMDCSMPDLTVHHQLLEFTQTHVHQVSDAVQPSHHLLALSFLYSPTLTSIHDYWKNIALTTWNFVDNVISLFFNMLSRLVIAFLPRSKHLLISWLQSPSAVILEPPKI